MDIIQNSKAQQVSLLLTHTTVLYSYGVGAFLTMIQSSRLLPTEATPHQEASESFTLSQQIGKEPRESSREF